MRNPILSFFTSTVSNASNLALNYVLAGLSVKTMDRTGPFRLTEFPAYGVSRLETRWIFLPIDRIPEKE